MYLILSSQTNYQAILPMNTSTKLKLITLLFFFTAASFLRAFSQSVTILPKSQTNTDTLSTRVLRVTEGAGPLKILMSDQVGNGLWVDPTLFTDVYWKTNNSGHLYQFPYVNLGVGTNAPSYKLDVRQTNANIIASFSGNNSKGTGIRISSEVSGTVDSNPVSTEWQLYHSGAGISSENGGYGQLHFKDQTGTRMILRNNGRVGIGVLNPAEMLEVNGNVRVDGKIDIRNTGNSVYIGEEAGKKTDVSDKYNTFIGYFSGKSTVNGGHNVAIGAGSLESNTSGDYNTVVGRLALLNNISGTHNTVLGASAGFSSTGSYNVFLGYNAGSAETGNDKLYIHNSSSTTPLIYGDFVERNMAVNGRLIIGAHTPYEGASKLDVIANDNGRFIVQNWTPSNNTLVVARLLSKTNKAPQMRFEGIGSGWMDIGQDTNGAFVVEGDDVSRFVVQNTGKVGVGVQSPAAQLEVSTNVNEAIQATSSAKYGAWFRLKNTSTGGKTWNFISTGEFSSEGVGSLAIKEETSDRMFIKSATGQVGFGTSNPGSQLEVVGTTNETLQANSSSPTGTWFSIRNTSTNGNTWKLVSLGNSNSEGAGHLLIKDAGGSKMIIKSNGAVGIGTETPTQAKLVINGSQTANLSYGYMNNKASTGTASGTNYYSIYTSDRIATSELNVYSDARIKKVKGLSDNLQDLNILKDIQITNYQLVDSVSKGNTTYKKVIAQQVEEVYPLAVTRMTDFIPDIYQLSHIEKGFIPLTNINLKAGDKLKLITDEKQEIAEVISVTAKGIQVNSESNGKVFVYGKEVNDFRTVDYEALATLNISATQELLKRIEILEKENQRINQLAKEVENLKNMVLVSEKGK